MFYILKLHCSSCMRFYNFYIFNGEYKDLKNFIYNLSEHYYDYYYLIFDSNGLEIDEIYFDNTDLI